MAKKIKRTVTPAELKEQLKMAEDRFRTASANESTESANAAFRAMQRARNLYYDSVDEGTPEELKKKISEAEANYREIFKESSCSAIMNAFYELQRAKRSYYCAIGVYKPTEIDIMDELANFDKIQENANSDSLI